MYKIIGSDGREYGPVPFETVQQWIQARRADGATRIRPEGTMEWTTIGSLPEFADTLRQVPPPLAAAAAPASPNAYAGYAQGPVDTGPSPLPDDVGERDYNLDLGDCLGRAWALLTGPNMWTVIGGVAVFLAIQIGISIMERIPLLGILFLIASVIVGGALKGGLYSFMLRWVRGQPAEVGNIFDGFRFCFGQLLLATIVIFLIVFATVLPGGAMVGAGAFMLTKEIAIPAAIALLALGVIAILVPIVYLSISWSMTIPLIIDKRLEFWPAMQLSRNVVGRHWWVIFGFMLVTGLIGACGVLACFVGIFFTLPLSTAAICYGYETLFGVRPIAPTAAVVVPLPTEPGHPSGNPFTS